MLRTLALHALLSHVGGDDDDDLSLDIDAAEQDSRDEEGFFDEGDNNLNDVDVDEDDF